MKITYQKKNWFENVIYDFRIDGDVDEHLAKRIANHITEEHKAQYFMEKTTWLRNIVVECDQNNKFNPAKFEVDRNKEVVEWLMAAGAEERK